MTVAIAVADDYVLGRDGQPPTRRHGVARVDAQVGQDLFDAAGVGLGRAQPVLGDEVNADRLGQHAAQQPQVVLDRGVHIDRRDVEILPVAEGEQLPGQVGRAIGRVADGGERALCLGGIPLCCLRAEIDDQDEVVEVVGDTAGEMAHGLELLRLPQLQLEALDRGDVDDRTDDVGRHAVVVGLYAGAGEQPAGLAAVPRRDAVLDVLPLTGLSRVVERRGDPRRSDGSTHRSPRSCTATPPGRFRTRKRARLRRPTAARRARCSSATARPAPPRARCRDLARSGAARARRHAAA